MAEGLKSEKTKWSEKKRHGSERQRRAAVSAQIARITEKLLDRAEGLDSSKQFDVYEKPEKYKGASHDFHGPTTDKREAYSVTHFNHETFHIASSEKAKKSAILRRPKAERTVTVEHGPGYSSIESLEVDPEGKRKPKDTMSWVSTGSRKIPMSATPGIPFSAKYEPTGMYVTPHSEDMIRHAAPILREIKNEIDAFDTDSEHKAAYK